MKFGKRYKMWLFCKIYLKGRNTCMDKRDEDTKKVYVYVDESGSITKTNISNNRYFVIAMLFTEEPEVVRRLFKKKISQLMRKNAKYKNMILSNKEIKGSDISETIKKQVYEHILKYASDKIEVGLIVLDNQYTKEKFIENHARTFNYMLQVYLDSCYRKHSKFMSGTGQMEFVVDEQNIATMAKYGLEEYLNQQLTICNQLCDTFVVRYTDSKNEKLVQLADFVANTFYRNIEKNNEESKANVGMWIPTLCNKDVFDFSKYHDIRLNL